MKLAALGSTLYVKNPAALLTQQRHDGIDQRQNQWISRRFRERQMKVEISLDVSLGILTLNAAIHAGNGLAHGGKQLIFDLGSRKRRNLRLENPAQLCQVQGPFLLADWRMACEVPLVTNVPRPV